MASGVDNYLKMRSNRCLLMLISDTHLDAYDCLESLIGYGNIKEIQLSSDFRAAFVDFKCEHAPLLAARCSSYHPHPKMPLPNGSKIILPGCSYQGYLFLRNVPRSLSTSALQKHFSKWNDGREVVIHRPDFADDSSRVLIKLNDAVVQDYTQNEVRIRYAKDEQGNVRSFLAIPKIAELTKRDSAKRVFDSDGCTQCNASQLRAIVEEEERKKYTASRPRPVLSEQESEVSLKELEKLTDHKHVDRCSLVLLSDTQLSEEEWVEELLYYGCIADMQFSSDSRAAFVDFKCEHAPLIVARCFVYSQRNKNVPMPKGLYAVLPACSVDNFLYLHVPDSLSSIDLNRLISDWTGLNVTVHREVADVSKPSTRAVVELHGALGSFQKQETDGEPMSVNVRFNGSCYCFHAIPHLPQLTDTSGIAKNEGCEGCNMSNIRFLMQMEEEKLSKEVNDEPVPPVPFALKTNDDDEEKK